MKRPIIAYSFWTEFNPRTEQWSTYFTKRDDEDGEPIGDEGYGPTPESSLAAACAISADYDDHRCEHDDISRWCPLCNPDDAE